MPLYIMPERHHDDCPCTDCEDTRCASMLKYADQERQWEAEKAEGFITKDSGERAEFEGGMVRDTEAGKPRFDLTEPEGVPYEEQLSTRFALLMGRGAEKYGDRNWEKATSEDAVKRARSSAYRHFKQWYHGDRQEDHAAAVMFNLMSAEATLWKIAQQKRPDVIEYRDEGQFTEMAHDGRTIRKLPI